MRFLLDVAAALSDENRVRALLALRDAPGGELCVCQVVELLGLAPSTVSRHLSVLRDAGLADARKQGRWMYYRATGDDAPDAARGALRWVRECLKDDTRAAADRRQLKVILECDPEELCDRQAKRAVPAAGSKCCSSAPATPAAAKWPKGGRNASKATASKPTRRAPTRTA